MANADSGNASDGIDKAVETGNSGVNSRKTNPVRWTVGLVVRLCIWYALLTPFFRCPSQLSELDGFSPRVCQPYLIARSHIEPHVLPYYNAYAAPYVDTARPYVQVAHDKIYIPAASVAKTSYDEYGAPALHQAQVYGKQQWETQVVPHINSAKGSACALYQAHVAPHADHVTALISPYRQKANAAFRSVCDQYIVPFYAHSRPFIGKTYTSGQDILTTSVLPYAQSTWSSAIYLANHELWPRIAGLYSENVEPQLVKIGQRLAIYREGKPLRSVVGGADSSSDPTGSTTPTSIETSQYVASATPSSAPITPPAHSWSPEEKAADARARIDSDISTWQERFIVAADQGAKDLADQIENLVEEYTKSDAKAYGESLATALNTTIESELTAAKSRMNELAGFLPFEDAPEEEEVAQEEFAKDIREAAITIRDHAHALREWHRSFDQELVGRVSTIVKSTLNVLDSVRDVGLQEIGIRWASMDEVTYKDWARYHALKTRFEDWKDEFNTAGLQNSKLEELRIVADEILSYGMDTAEAAAKELARLKDVGKWKIAAREVNDDFETRSGSPPPRPQPIIESEQVAEDDESVAGEKNRQLPTDVDEQGSHTTVIADETDHHTDDQEELGFDDAPLHDDEQDTRYDTEETAEASTPQTEDESPQFAWGANAEPIPGQGQAHKVPDAASQADNERAETTKAASETTSQSTDAQPSSSTAVPQDDVEALISKLLADKGSSLSDDVLNKLHAIYGAAVPSSSPAPAENIPNINDAMENASEKIQSATSIVYEKATSAASAAIASGSALGAKQVEAAREAIDDAFSSVESAIDDATQSSSSTVARYVDSAAATPQAEDATGGDEEAIHGGDL
ncbi:uncharacterized protein BDW47DRAFT_113126 [Aspergillus candidus]|uniref:Transcription factor hoxa13 n=1 Tax=Aspergillus candidus TaxID=41067 RepID=A0A2I2F019_ASPCN|nr:hypothetical protein BDW47DRAFT_113126 [Aspergillus candidus]PLB33948.1 hypothetical protein BDW47DRAFT_113126 [Aspergillus candidus]